MVSFFQAGMPLQDPKGSTKKDLEKVLKWQLSLKKLTEAAKSVTFKETEKENHRL